MGGPARFFTWYVRLYTYRTREEFSFEEVERINV
jgi:hypothetical protein